MSPIRRRTRGFWSLLAIAVLAGCTAREEPQKNVLKPADPPVKKANPEVAHPNFLIELSKPEVISDFGGGEVGADLLSRFLVEVTYRIVKGEPDPAALYQCEIRNDKDVTICTTREISGKDLKPEGKFWANVIPSPASGKTVTIRAYQETMTTRRTMTPVSDAVTAPIIWTPPKK